MTSDKRLPGVFKAPFREGMLACGVTRHPGAMKMAEIYNGFSCVQQTRNKTFHACSISYTFMKMSPQNVTFSLCPLV